METSTYHWWLLMKYVRVEPLSDCYGYHLDPQIYLDALPEISAHLPAGAAAFATDPEHYDFQSARCVKDLEWRKAGLVENEGQLSLELAFAPNEWKHVVGLYIVYLDVQSFHLNVEETDGTLPRLGPLQLDEMTPHLSGFTHEIAFTCGSIVVVAADLVATWA